MRRSPGEIRDAIISYLSTRQAPATVQEIEIGVQHRVAGEPRQSSIRSYLRLNTPNLFERVERGRYRLVEESNGKHSTGNYKKNDRTTCKPALIYGRAKLFHADCMDWLDNQKEASIHAVLTDPPYGLVEYAKHEQAKLRKGRGGVWRIPPSFDGVKRAPLPRFTTLTDEDRDQLVDFFFHWGEALIRVLVPGANVVVASNPLLSHLVSYALTHAGLERRGEIIRLVMTMRGGDRPKNAHDEFKAISVMPRSMWEPWLLFRKPLEGRVQDNLRKWGTGGFRRPSSDRPFGDVIKSSPTQKTERDLAPHPSLKPQAFLRQLTRAILPLGKGVVLDPFAGSGSTLAACEAVDYESVGVEKDAYYLQIARRGIPNLTQLALRR